MNGVQAGRTPVQQEAVALRRSHQSEAVLVSYYFPPFNIVASQRALRLARVLLSRYEHVHVVTIPLANLATEYLDEDLGRDVRADPRLSVWVAEPALPGYGIVQRPQLAHRLIGACLTRVLCSMGGDWAAAVARTLDRILQQHRIGVIVSTGGPFVPFVAAVRCAARAGIPLVVDYRDLWTQNPRAPYPRLFRHLIRNTAERYVNTNAALITTVSEGCRRSLKTGADIADVHVLPNTPDSAYREWFGGVAAASQQYAQRDHLHIALTGTIYPDCTCTTLLRALQRLPSSLSDRVRVHYAGASGNLASAEFASAGMTPNLIDYGLLRKNEAIALVKGADLLLSLVSDSSHELNSTTVNGLMTTKVFDYFLSGKPVLNVGPPAADLNVMAASSGYAEFHSFTGVEVDEIAAFLTEALKDLNQFRRRAASAQLLDFAECFDRVLDDVHR